MEEKSFEQFEEKIKKNFVILDECEQVLNIISDVNSIVEEE